MYSGLPYYLLLIGWLAVLPLDVSAKPLQVVATTPSMGVLATVVGGDRVAVHVLAGADRDAHTLNARPSMLARLRRADMVIAVGAQLEEGWLPAALDGAANPRLRRGQAGHFVAADASHLRPTRFDPTQGGHVHGEGNPHFNLSPARMGEVALALAERLGQLSPDTADEFHRRAERFAAQTNERIALLAAKLQGRVRLLAYHEEFDYFSEWLPVEVVDFIEAKPGVPPTPGHLARLVEAQRGTTGRIVRAVYQSDAAAKRLGDTLGWPVNALMLEPTAVDAEGYFSLMEQWVDALSQ